MRRLAPSLALALAACTVAFPPPRAGDGGPGSDGALARPDGALADGALTEDLAWVDRAPPVGLDPRAVQDRAVDRDPLDWAVLPDLAPRDLAVVEDAEPPRVRFELRQSPEEGCAARDVTLRWAANWATSCRLTVLNGAVYEDLAPADELTLRLTAETNLDLFCEGPKGSHEARVPITFSPVLADSVDLVRGVAGLRRAQQRCARALGEPPMDEESEIRDDDRSAARLCACEGYGVRQIVSTDRSCFATPHDNGIWRFDNGWRRDPATRHNRCTTHLRCTRPVTTCAELLYPK